MFTKRETTQDICDSMTKRLQVIADREQVNINKANDTIENAQDIIDGALCERKTAGNSRIQAINVITKVKAFFSEA